MKTCRSKLDRVQAEATVNQLVRFVKVKNKNSASSRLDALRSRRDSASSGSLHNFWPIKCGRKMRQIYVDENCNTSFGHVVSRTQPD